MNITKERPILFSAPMVKAIMEDRKTQTRRVITPQPVNPVGPNFDGGFSDTKDPVTRYFWCPYGVPLLYVRETWAVGKPFDHIKPSELPPPTDDSSLAVDYAANDERLWSEPDQGRWRPSIHMPKWASRIALEVTEVGIQRVQQIDAEDAIAEGIPLAEHKCGCEKCSQTSQLCPATQSSLILAYGQLWDSINAERGHGWETDPWVWVISFRRVGP